MTEDEKTVKDVADIDISDLHKREMEAYSMFSDEYILQDPLPSKPASFSVRKLGIDFWIVLFTGISSVIQASLRTGAKFMDLAKSSGWGPLLTWIDGGTAMIGVEGIVFTAGLFLARSHPQEDEEVHIHKKAEFWWAVAIALSISVITGAAQSISGTSFIPDQAKQALDWFILLLLGPGASILAFFAGELVGITTIRAQSLWRAEMAIYDTKVEEHRQRLQEAWEGSSFYKLLHVDIDGAAMVAQKRYARESRGPSAPKPINEEKQSLFRRVEDWLVSNGIAAQDVGTHEGARLSVKDLAEQLGLDANHYPDPKELERAKGYLHRVVSELKKR